MNNKQEKMTYENGQLVYVRSVKIDELPDEVRDRIDGLTELYALHSSNGERLALVKERELAFVLARQSDLLPVTVH
jgi:hypothetical protein